MHPDLLKTGRPEASAAREAQKPASFWPSGPSCLLGGEVRGSRVPHWVHAWAYKEARYTLEDGPRLSQHSPEGLDTGTPAHQLAMADVGARRDSLGGRRAVPAFLAQHQRLNKPQGAGLPNSLGTGWTPWPCPQRGWTSGRAKGAGPGPEGHSESSSLGLRKYDLPGPSDA